MADSETAAEVQRPEGFGEAAGQPPNTTIIIPNFNALETIIALPGSGKLWVAYEYSSLGPAKRVYLWHQGGQYVNIEPGFHEYESRGGDMIGYLLANPEQTIKLGWAYV